MKRTFICFWGGRAKEGFYNYDFVKLDGMVDVLGQLEQLPLATHLKDVNLRRTDIGDSDLKTIGQVERLLTLNIASTKVTDAGLDQLSTLANLSRLDARGLGITFEKLPPLPGIEPAFDLRLKHNSRWLFCNQQVARAKRIGNRRRCPRRSDAGRNCQGSGFVRASD